MEYYLVGGAVRDKLLGLEPKDLDYVVIGETPVTMLNAGYVQVGKTFPVFLHPQTRAEYALARKEKSNGSKHTDFICDFSPDITLIDDLERRDLTINAMALSINGELTDPFNGRSDLEKRIIRHVGSSFIEDPLRILRAVRLAAKLDFRICDETMSLIKEMVNENMLSDLSSERIFNELEKGLMTNNPDIFLRLLKETGVLEKILPEVNALYGVPQPAEHHPEIDTGIHIEMVLKACVKHNYNLDVRLASLLHDIGKGTTPKETLPKHIFHEDNGALLLNSIFDRFPFSSKTERMILFVTKNHTRIHGIFNMKNKSISKLFESVKIHSQNRDEFIDILSACHADSVGRLGFESRSYLQKQFLTDCFDHILKMDKSVLVGMKDPAKIKDILHNEKIKIIKDVRLHFEIDSGIHI